MTLALTWNFPGAPVPCSHAFLLRSKPTSPKTTVSHSTIGINNWFQSEKHVILRVHTRLMLALNHRPIRPILASPTSVISSFHHFPAARPIPSRWSSSRRRTKKKNMAARTNGWDHPTEWLGPTVGTCWDHRHGSIGDRHPLKCPNLCLCTKAFQLLLCFVSSWVCFIVCGGCAG